MLAFIANTLNSIIKSIIYFFLYLKISIFHSASTTLLLSLNIILISHTNSSQSWISISLSSSSSFFWIYIPAMPSLWQTRITVILSSVPVTLLLLRNNWILLYQFSNFVLSLSNHPRSKIILFDNSVCSFYIFAGASTADILSVYSVILSKTSSMIFNDLSFPNSTSISYSQY